MMKFLIKLLFPEPELGINQHMRRVLAQDATNALEQTARQISAELSRGPEPELGINQHMRRVLSQEPARQISAELSRGPGDVALELAVFGGKAGS